MNGPQRILIASNKFEKSRYQNAGVQYWLLSNISPKICSVDHCHSFWNIGTKYIDRVWLKPFNISSQILSFYKVPI